MKRFISSFYVKVVLLILGVVLVFLLILFVREYQILQQKRLNHPLQSFLMNLRNKGPLTIQDINYIEPWMTFDYINHLFNLPADYLKIQLTISDSRYPHITVNQYEQTSNLTSGEALSKIKNAVSAYLTNPQ